MAVVVWYLSLILSNLSFYPNLTQVLRVIFLTIYHNMIRAYFPVFNLWIRWLSAVIDCISESHRINSQLSVGFMRSLVLLHWHEWLPMGSMIAKWTASDAVIVNSKDASESCQQKACLQYDAIDLFLLWNASGQLFGGPMCWENLHMCTVLLASRLEQRDEGWEVKLGAAGLIGWISTTLREEYPNMKIIHST